MKKITNRKLPKPLPGPQHIQRPKLLFKPLDAPIEIINDSGSDLEFPQSFADARQPELLIQQYIGELPHFNEGMVFPISAFTTQLDSENTSCHTQECESERTHKQNTIVIQRLETDLITLNIEANQLLGKLTGLEVFYGVLARNFLTFQPKIVSTTISMTE